MRLNFTMLCAAALASSASAQALYSQDPGDTVGFGFYSSAVSRPTRGYKHADDFTLAVTADVSTITWRGMSEGRQHTDLRNVSKFRVEFFSAAPSADGDVPGALLRAQVFTLAQSDPELTGRAAFDTGALEYAHSVTLATPFTVDAGTKYFLAISVIPVNTSNDAWLWQDGQTLNGLSGLYTWATSKWSVYNDTDSCFSLAAPSPGTAALFAPALIGLAQRRSRTPSPH